MEVKTENKPTIIFHPLLFAICPILSLFLINREIVLAEIFFRDLLISLVITSLLWIALKFLLKNNLKAAVLLSSFLFVFLSFKFLLFTVAGVGALFGHYLDARRLSMTQPALIIWFVVCSILYILLVYVVLKDKTNIKNISAFLNIISLTWLLAIMIPSFIIPNINSMLKKQPTQGDLRNAWIEKINSEPCTVSAQNDQPDIYYIILDEYGRQDVLNNIYHLDGSEFYRTLQEQGFYIADESRSNYQRTVHSLASSLNMEYLDRLSEETGLDSIQYSHSSSVISNNRVFHQLRCLGYKIYSFKTDFDLTEITSSDKVYSLRDAPTGFENIIIENTPLAIPLQKQPYARHRDQVRYALNTLPQIAAQQDGPKFVFAHVVSPHAPFIFGANGEEIYPPFLYEMTDGKNIISLGSESDYIKGYRDQATYLAKLVAASVQGILENSAQPPIIIIQGDHGPALHYDVFKVEETDVNERYPILNAYYLTGVAPDKVLYPGISPVNTFRIIFNTYFGAHYPLLADKSYFSPEDALAHFTDVTSQIAVRP